MNQWRNLNDHFMLLLALTQHTTSKPVKNDKAFKVTYNSKHQQQMTKFGENNYNNEMMNNG